MSVDKRALQAERDGNMAKRPSRVGVSSQERQ